MSSGDHSCHLHTVKYVAQGMSEQTDSLLLLPSPTKVGYCQSGGDLVPWVAKPLQAAEATLTTSQSLCLGHGCFLHLGHTGHVLTDFSKHSHGPSPGHRPPETQQPCLSLPSTFLFPGRFGLWVADPGDKGLELTDYQLQEAALAPRQVWTYDFLGLTCSSLGQKATLITHPLCPNPTHW